MLPAPGQPPGFDRPGRQTGDGSLG